MELNYSTEELASIWNTLNNWEWDDRLGVKPEAFDNLPNFKFSDKHTNPTKRDYISHHMKQIRDRIGEKECLRYHHVNNRGRTNIQFECWWYKRVIQKVFGVGFYSRRMQRAMRDMLSEIKKKNQKEWVEKNF